MWPAVSNPADNPTRHYAEFLRANGFHDPDLVVPPRARRRPRVARAIRALAVRLTATANRLDPACRPST